MRPEQQQSGISAILDNLGSHKGKAVRKAIRDVGARLVFPPKYSPDLNPIEQVFAKSSRTCLQLPRHLNPSQVHSRCPPRPNVTLYTWDGVAT